MGLSLSLCLSLSLSVVFFLFLSKLWALSCGLLFVISLGTNLEIRRMINCALYAVVTDRALGLEPYAANIH